MGPISTSAGVLSSTAHRTGDAVTPPSADVTRGGIAGIGVLLVGANVQAKYGVTTALLPVVLLSPVWVPAVGRYRSARPLMVMAGFAVACGLLLSWLATSDHEVNTHQEIASALMVITAFGAVGLLLWAAETLRVDTTAILFGVGLAGSHLVDHAGWAANPWKYGFALPVAIVAVALAGRAGSVWLGVVVLAGIGLVSAFSDYRSFAGFCVITILILTWQSAMRSANVRIHRAAPLLMLSAVGLGAYFILSNLVVAGYLGARLQERSVAEIQASGSLLIGGRPEWAATVELMTERPQGFGFGVLPNAVDVNHGDAGLRSLNIDPANGYELYMFDGGFRLHSIVADLWVAAGWAGLLLATCILLLLLRALAAALADHTATAVLVFTTVLAIWALAFSPIFTDLKDLTLAVFVALNTRARATGAGKIAADYTP